MRYRLRTLLWLTLAAAMFFAGYRLGWQQGNNARLTELIKLIEATVVPSHWQSFGPEEVKSEQAGAKPVEPDDPFRTP